jgi:general stress protein YciG
MTMAKSQHRGGSGNFAENRQRASEAGRKGGQHSRQQSQGGTNNSNRQQGDNTSMSESEGAWERDRPSNGQRDKD